MDFEFYYISLQKCRMNVMSLSHCNIQSICKSIPGMYSPNIKRFLQAATLDVLVDNFSAKAQGKTKAEDDA